MTEPVQPPSDQVIAGVRLDKYASVHAAVGDGFPLPAVLEHEGIAADAWDDIETAWAKALLHSFKGEGHLVVAYDEQLLAAKDRLWRAMPPIDRDVRLWLDFLRHWAAAEEPSAFLAHHRVGAGDFTRLHRHWSARLEHDEALRGDAFQALCAEPGPVPEVQPGPAVLPPPCEAPAATLPMPVPAASPPPPPPTAEPPPEDKPGLPALAVPLPPPPDESEPVPARPAPRKSTAPPPNRISLPPPSLSFDTETPAPSAASAKLTLTVYASLCAELEVFPGDADIAYGKYGLHNPIARAAERASWEAHLARSPDAMAEWKDHYENFLKHWRAMRAAMRRL
jgi:hypothetical protein